MCQSQFYEITRASGVFVKAPRRWAIGTKLMLRVVVGWVAVKQGRHDDSTHFRNYLVAPYCLCVVFLQVVWTSAIILLSPLPPSVTLGFPCDFDFTKKSSSEPLTNMIDTFRFFVLPRHPGKVFFSEFLKKNATFNLLYKYQSYEKNTVFDNLFVFHRELYLLISWSLLSTPFIDEL